MATKKTATKKAATKKAATKTAATKKPATKKAATKKPAEEPVAKKTATKKTATTKTATTTAPKKSAADAQEAGVDGYIASLLPWQREVVDAVEALLRTEAPKLTSSIKWSHPVYAQNGKPFAIVRAAAKHVLFGFWGDGPLPDPQGLLEGDSLRHVKLKTPQDLQRSGIPAMVRASLVNNAAG